MTAPVDDNPFHDPKIARDWIRVVEREGGSREADLYPFLRAWVDRVKPSELLEIGCGQGIASDKIDLRGRHYTGVEPSALLVERAKEKYPGGNRRFLTGDAYRLPFPDGAFDGIFSVAVWHLLSDPNRAAGELSRVSKAGGHYLILTANAAAPDHWTGLYTESRRDGPRLDGKRTLDDGTVVTETLYLHSREVIRASLESAGLPVRETGTMRREAYLWLEGTRR